MNIGSGEGTFIDVKFNYLHCCTTHLTHLIWWTCRFLLVIVFTVGYNFKENNKILFIDWKVGLNLFINYFRATSAVTYFYKKWVILIELVKVKNVY